MLVKTLINIILLLYHYIKEVFSQYKVVPKDRNMREHLRSHARGVYYTQDTSRMGTARVKQEEETDTRTNLTYSQIYDPVLSGHRLSYGMG